VFGPLLQRLEALGFRPLARVRQEIVCNGARWQGNYRIAVFVGDEALATGYRLMPFEAVRFAYYTSFADGSVVVTASSMPQLVIDEGGYSRWGLDSNDPDALLTAHRERVAARLAQGAELVIHRSLDDLERIAMQEWNAPVCRKAHRRLAFQNLKVLGLIAGGLSLAIWERGGPMDWQLGLPAAIMTVVIGYVGLITFFYGLFTLKNWYARRGQVIAAHVGESNEPRPTSP
jgi:hypothetical protein